jgi:beta-fructofuranosidase
VELYELGKYTQRQFIRDRRLNRGLFDYGHLYASKTFWDGKTGTRVLWGWSSEEDQYGADRGWQGIMALPRKVIFDEQLGQLRTPPVDAVNQLRSARLLSKERVELKHLNEVVLPVSSNQLEVSINVPVNQCDGEISVQLHVRRSQHGTEYTAVTVTPSSAQKCGTIGVDRAKAGGSTPASPYAAPIFCTDANRDVVSARVFVDVSVVEAYANDGASVITARVYPPEEYNGVSLVAVTRGNNCVVAVENLQVYSMSSIGLDQ